MAPRNNNIWSCLLWSPVVLCINTYPLLCEFNALYLRYAPPKIVAWADDGCGVVCDEVRGIGEELCGGCARNKWERVARPNLSSSNLCAACTWFEKEKTLVLSPLHYYVQQYVLKVFEALWASWKLLLVFQMLVDAKCCVVHMLPHERYQAACAHSHWKRPVLEHPSCSAIFPWPLHSPLSLYSSLWCFEKRTDIRHFDSP